MHRTRWLFLAFACVLFAAIVAVPPPQACAATTPTLAASMYTTIGLRADGTCLLAGGNMGGSGAVISSWKNVVDIDARDWNTAALRANGTVGVAGEDFHGQFAANSWTGMVDIAVGEHFIAGLRADGTCLTTGIVDLSGWTNIVAIDAGDADVVGVRADGTCVVAGTNAATFDVSGWTNIVSMSVFSHHILGLNADGSCVATGCNAEGECDVSGWSDIVAIAAGDHYSLGLQSNGTCVAIGTDASGECQVNGWTNVGAIGAGMYHSAVMFTNGVVIGCGYNKYNQCETTMWNLLYDFSADANEYYSVAVRYDGTCVTAGTDLYGAFPIVESWTNVAAVAVGESHTVALRTDGTCVAAGANDAGQCNVGSWTGIIDVAAGGDQTIGLRANGTCVATGGNDRGECQVSSWTGIKAIASGWQHTVGLKTDGTCVAAGNNDSGQCDVGAWAAVFDISAGDRHTVALSDPYGWDTGFGMVLGAGEDAYRQCTGAGADDFGSLSAGGRHTLGLDAYRGFCGAFGDNAAGQCDVGDTWSINKVVAGGSHTLLIRADGTVYALGSNEHGQLAAAEWNLASSGLANHAPVGGADATWMHAAEGINVPVAALLANDTDADGDQLGVVWMDQDNGHGYVFKSGPDTIGFYNLSPTTPGTPNGFDYALWDGKGSIVQVHVNVDVLADNQVAPPIGGGAIQLPGSAGSMELPADAPAAPVVTVDALSSTYGPPTGFTVADSPTYYDISMAPPYAGSELIKLTLAYDDAGMTEDDERALRLLHWTGSDWEDITWLDPGNPDITANTIVGYTSSLSPLAVFIMTNQAPEVTGVQVPSEPVKLGSSIQATATFTDANAGDTHTATWDWGDGTTSAGQVDEATSGFSGSHTYSSAGVYQVGVAVQDAAGASDEGAAAGYVVVYDPTAGFVTGGGWITSPAGALIADSTTSGNASFGFVSKYQKGATTPTGTTQFYFSAGGLAFESSSYDWMVIAGTKAMYQGTGTVNGAEGYRFALTAVDGRAAADRFRIRIWGQSGLVYDNMVGAAESPDLEPPPIGGGSIVLHK